MRKTRAAICSAAVLGISVLGSSAQAANESPFLGTWASTDHDGSSQTLGIMGGGSGHFAVSLYDDAATAACGGAPARIAGSGSADGNDLVMVGVLTCVPGGNFLRTRIAIDFHYDSSTDTLTDFSGVVWHRS